MLSVILPASNEEPYIADCLAALFHSTAKHVQLIVVANGCHDRTAAAAQDIVDQSLPVTWQATVIELSEGSKPGALNAGDAAAQYENRLYLDADVIVTPSLLQKVDDALSVDHPLYATARAIVPPAKSWFSRQYTRFWLKLPFNQTHATGYGLFATNALGRQRWGEFPKLISDDTFVRLQFSPAERIEVAATYTWPMIEGFSALVRVRRRQNAGVDQLKALYPAIFENEAKPPLTVGGLASLFLKDPLGFLCYTTVALAVRSKRGGTDFTRGR